MNRRAFGEKILPALADSEKWEVAGTYSGLRPATEHRDYIVESRPCERWVTVAGIRSTGLTASSALGEHVAALLVRDGLALARQAKVEEGEEEEVKGGNSSSSSSGSRAPAFCLDADGLDEAITLAGQGGQRSVEAAKNGAYPETRLMGVSESAAAPLPLSPSGKRRCVPNADVPALRDLSENYRHRGDGSVEVYGRPMFVTHPISSFGMEAGSVE